MQIIKTAQLEGHKSSIYALTQGAEPHLVYTGGGDRFIVEWNLEEHAKSRLLLKMPERVFALRYLKDQNLLLAGSYLGEIFVINPETSQQIQVLKHHQQMVFEMAPIPGRNAFIALAGDGSFSVWSLEDYTLLHAHKVGHFKLRSVDFHPGRKEMAIGSEDGFIRIFDLVDFNEKHLLEGHFKGFSVNSVKYIQGGKQLISGSRDAYLVLWDVEQDYSFQKGFNPMFMRYTALSPVLTGNCWPAGVAIKP
jgi:WD40 repeat protein